MSSRAKRVVAASAVLGMTGAGAAAIPAAAASGPVIVGDCGAHVHAKKGQRLELSLSDALGIDGLPNIPLGTAHSGTHKHNPKGKIEHALAGKGLLGGLLGTVTGTVGHVLDVGCPVIVTVKDVVNGAAAPVEHLTKDVTKPVRKVTGNLLETHHATHPTKQHAPTHHSTHSTSSAQEQAGHSHTPAAHQATHRSTHSRVISPALTKELSLPPSAFSVPVGSVQSRISPAAFDTRLPFEYPGLFAPPHFDDLDGVPGAAPKFTPPGKEGVPDPAKAGADAVHTAGNAKALGRRAPQQDNTVSLPPLVAALALAGAVAALVRTWVLRRPT
jgi:hypothetical protein